MSENLKLNYHEVDFIVPVHRFNIQFSYVTKQGLSFIREFVLRLVQLAPMKPSQIAIYIGLNKAEMNEAISDLMDKGDLRFNKQGQVELTPQSEGYFDGLGKPPRTSSIQETGATLSFELCSFNCIGNKRSSGGWKQGIELKVDNQKLSRTVELAKSVFQKEFYQYLDKDFLKGVRTEDSDRPSIYTMGSVSKLTKDSLRLTCKFYVDPDGRAIEREDFDELDHSTEVHELITRTLGQNRKASNVSNIAQAMKSIGDYWTKDVLNDNSVDLSSFTRRFAESLVDDKKPLVFVGSIYAKNNWEHVSNKLKNVLDKFNKSKDNTVRDLKWIVPSDSFWGKTSRITSCLEELEGCQLTKGENPQRVFQPSIHFPLSDVSDRRALGKWKHDFSGSTGINYGLLEGFMGGSVEVLFMENEFVVVCYHISRPDSLSVTMPVGFISTDAQVIRKVSELADEYISNTASFNTPNDLGLLKNL
ncbi:hypothetical protein [Photobacterium profundum]|uniref:Uncharacterized protein n=1 Tax=Photobacterium profundum (strain SS9) TaxID=298386 RepID=Q6LRT0_PHOPR|nr:hypothetical protein [Photobacterium profundum]CAG19996.1 hypothetical protein PBPRA1585 [Photobacterium profundum SS9]